jgi:hypothetical protein
MLIVKVKIKAPVNKAM